MLPSVMNFEPIHHPKIWGDESWLLSDFPPYYSKVSLGLAQGRTLRDLYQSEPEAILGEPKSPERFPLLIKLIHAKEKLSVQVHPSDEYAREKDPESFGKSECWLVLKSEPGATITIGFDEPTDREHFSELVAQNKAETVLKQWKVKSGDVFVLNPGTIHAIGAGVTLLEVQQNSDSTYRVYDYGRLDSEGNPRPLHIEKALDVLNFEQSKGEEKISPSVLSITPFERILLASHRCFRVESWQFIQGQFLPIQPPVFHGQFGFFYVLRGSLSFPNTGNTFRSGESFFLTAESYKSQIRPFVDSRSSLVYVTTK